MKAFAEVSVCVRSSRPRTLTTPSKAPESAEKGLKDHPSERLLFFWVGGGAAWVTDGGGKALKCLANPSNALQGGVMFSERMGVFASGTNPTPRNPKP